MSNALVISVRLHGGSYHGSGAWPPAPGRLFQALVAAGAKGRHLSDEDHRALEWLEGCGPPIVAAPAAREGKSVTLYLPNNDIDKVGGDPTKMASQKTAKRVRAYHFGEEDWLVYAWRYTANSPHPAVIKRLAEQLYQFGRGVDMAWAKAQLVDDNELEQSLGAFRGVVYRPGLGQRPPLLACPRMGTLASLSRRFEAQTNRFRSVSLGRSQQVALSQAPPPQFESVSYGGTSETSSFELKEAVSLRQVGALTTALKEAATIRLGKAFPELHAEIEGLIAGRPKKSGASRERVRVVPLPSVGHRHADMAVRNVWIEVPPSSLPVQDIQWAFSGLRVDTDPSLGAAELTAVSNDLGGMPRHYGIEAEKAYQAWVTVTPMVLPQTVSRRRLSPKRQKAEAKGAAERMREQAAATSAARQALRHAGVGHVVTRIEVQREPFHATGERAERFAEGTRFPKERLWHVRLEFGDPIIGPLILGDGRYTGLGLFAPVPATEEVLKVFRITGGLQSGADVETVCHHFRRAVMSLFGDLPGKGAIDPVFSGHSSDGADLDHKHLFFGAELDARQPRVFLHGWLSSEQRRCLDKVALKLQVILAGPAGELKVKSTTPERRDDPAFGWSRHWASSTDYIPTRHPKGTDQAFALESDIRVELARRGFPEPASVRLLRVYEGRRGGVKVRLSLSFDDKVAGPILLGRTSHFGGGLMRRADSRA